MAVTTSSFGATRLTGSHARDFLKSVRNPVNNPVASRLVEDALKNSEFFRINGYVESFGKK